MTSRASTLLTAYDDAQDTASSAVTGTMGVAADIRHRMDDTYERGRRSGEHAAQGRTMTAGHVKLQVVRDHHRR